MPIKLPCQIGSLTKSQDEEQQGPSPDNWAGRSAATLLSLTHTHLTPNAKLEPTTVPSPLHNPTVCNKRPQTLPPPHPLQHHPPYLILSHHSVSTLPLIVVCFVHWAGQPSSTISNTPPIFHQQYTNANILQHRISIAYLVRVCRLHPAPGHGRHHKNWKHSAGALTHRPPISFVPFFGKTCLLWSQTASGPSYHSRS